jgi:hypothetical protein
MDEWRSTELAAVVRRAAPSPTSPTTCWPPCWTCWPAATRPTSSPSCAPGSCGTASPASCGAAPAPSAWPSPARHHPRPGPVRRVPARRHPGGRAGRGDGLRVPAGETFLLGASTWRIEDITHDRVVVTPAPGQPGKMPFWHGDGPGPPLRAGRAMGAFVRELRAMDRRRGHARLRTRPRPGRAGRPQPAGLPRRAGRGHRRVPDDRTIVVERFRDEIGDWRVCLLSPSAPRCTPRGPWRWGPADRRVGLDPEMMWTDDGIVLRLPEAVEELPSTPWCPTPTRSRSWSPPCRHGHVRLALPGVRGPALLLPRAAPTSAPAVAAAPAGRRPAGGRGQVPHLPDPAGGHPRVPATTCSTCRRCATAGRPAADRRPHGGGRHRPGLAHGPVAAVRLDRRLHVRGRRAAGRTPGRGAGPRPRPAARAARRRGAARAARPDVLADLELELQHLADGWRPATPRPTTAGPATPTSCTTCCGCSVDLDPSTRWLAACDRARTRRSSAWFSRLVRRAPGIASVGRRGPGGRRPRTRPGCATRSAWRCRWGCRRRSPTRSTTRWPTWWPATPAPTARSTPRECRGAPRHGRASGSRPVARVGRGDRVVQGEFRPDGHRARVVRPRRAAPAAAPVAGRAAPRGRAGRRATPRPVPARWHGIGRATAARRGRAGRPIAQLQGAPIPRRARADVLPARLADYPRRPRRSCAPPARWCGSAPGPSGPATAGSCCASATRPHLLAPTRAGRPARRRGPRGPADHLGQPGRRSGPTCSPPAASLRPGPRARRAVGPGVGRRGHQRHLPGGAGARARGGRPRRGTGHQRHARARAGCRRVGPAVGPGTLVTDHPTAAGAGAPPTPTRAHALAEQLLERHGVVTAEACAARGPGGFAPSTRC